MHQRLFVATRKGLLDLRRSDGDWQIANRAFVGEPVSMVWQGQGVILAALNLGHFGTKLHRSTDDGNSWQEVAVPSYPAEKERSEETAEDSGPSLQMIWSLEADHRGHLWAGTLPGGLFVSRDWGDSWKLNDALWNQPSRSEWFGGGYDAPGIHSICIDPRNPDWLTVGISCGGVWQSRDGGCSWQPMTRGMRAEYVPPEQQDNPAIQDPHRLVQCPGAPDHFWVQHHNGIFYSQDNCATWQEITARPSSFGFAVAVHPEQPRRAWFVPAIKDEFRYPVGGKLVVTRTDDGGEHFESLDKGLPDEESFDLVYRHGLAIDVDGHSLAMA
ncbi:WD40/YVTN/BNR-like repeat-containing protein, partial [Pseudomaricurvus sp.]|uniref:WD40/YVTN/BNR-like repeat-containing protein n=1 Tax=Pseudomaricurvus sp. TaxID=2004510 RepID=UPI003F6CC907